MKKNVFFVVLFIGLIFSVFGQSVNDFEYKVENGKITITKYKGSVKSVVIPEKINGLPVVAIGREAFTIFAGENIGYYGLQLTSITFPNSITTIGDIAFSSNQLTSITLPNSITSIGNGAFSSNQLTSITLPNSIISIGGSAFAYNQLTSITLPNSLTSIGNGAFAYNQLTSITFPNSVKTIGGSAFADNQLTSITIPNSITSIGDYAFSSNKLTSITFPNSVKTIGGSAFADNQLTSITLPNSLTSIGGSAFNHNKLTSITIPNSITSIGDYAFAHNKLTSITFPNSVKTIGGSAFAYNQLTSITIPNSVITIGYGAFSDNKLTSVAVPTSVVNLDSNAFDRNVRITRGQATPSNPMTNEILNYPKASESRFAVLKSHTRTYTRDSYNAAWFDRHKESGNPNVVINRKSQYLPIANGALTNEYRFETTFYNSNKNVVVSVDVSIQFIDSPVVYVIYIPYAQQNHYERRRQVDEPSGKYALYEESVPCEADAGAKAFIQLYEQASKRIITNFQ